jgi:hypothetical protein
MDRMMEALLRRSLLGGINLGDMHRHEGPMVGFLEEQCLSLAHRQRRVSTAWRSGVLNTDVP